MRQIEEFGFYPMSSLSSPTTTMPHGKSRSSCSQRAKPDIRLGATYPDGPLEATLETVKVLNADYGVQMLNGGPLDWNAAVGNVDMGLRQAPVLEQ
jgi:hypothetical protein